MEASAIDEHVTNIDDSLNNASGPLKGLEVLAEYDRELEDFIMNVEHTKEQIQDAIEHARNLRDEIEATGHSIDVSELVAGLESLIDELDATIDALESKHQ